MSHTPGPWILTEVYPDAGWLEELIGLDGTHVVCTGHDYNDGGSFGWPKCPPKNDYAECKAVALANARLIAAAPELLAALDHLSGHASTAYHLCATDEEWMTGLRAARAVVAKAKGA